MELEAKEMRMVILGLKKLLEETKGKLAKLSDEEDEYTHLANDAMLLVTMISGFEKEYEEKYGS